MGDRVKIGIQTWGIQAGGDLRFGKENATSYEELIKILKELKAAGYDGIEWTSAMFDSGYDLKQLKKDMDEIGLDNISVHYHYLGKLDTEDNIQKAVDNCRTFGNVDIILAWTMPMLYGIPCAGNVFDPNFVPDFPPEVMDAWVEEINKTAERVRRAAKGTGIRILYHNHLGEFLKCSDGSYAIEKLAMDGLELDAYWAVKGIRSFDGAVDFLEKNGSRIALLHMKDGLRASFGALHDDCSWGDGTYDLQRFVDVARKNHIPYAITDQDHPAFCGKTGMQDALDTIHYAKSNLTFDFC